MNPCRSANSTLIVALAATRCRRGRGRLKRSSCHWPRALQATSAKAASISRCHSHQVACQLRPNATATIASASSANAAAIPSSIRERPRRVEPQVADDRERRRARPPAIANGDQQAAEARSGTDGSSSGGSCRRARATAQADHQRRSAPIRRSRRGASPHAGRRALRSRPDSGGEHRARARARPASRSTNPVFGSRAARRAWRARAGRGSRPPTGTRARRGSTRASPRRRAAAPVA